MPNNKLCPICGQKKPNKWDMCKECLEIYRADAESWPEWLRELINSGARWYYTDQQTSINEEPIEDFEFYIDQYWNTTEVLHTRPREETRIITDADSRVRILGEPRQLLLYLRVDSLQSFQSDHRPPCDVLAC